VQKLECLKDLHGAERIASWKDLVRRAAWRDLILDLLDNHYDPAYRRSMFRNYRGMEAADRLDVADASRAGFRVVAGRLASIR
jgi:tRNA 2-selenouridine synthase